MGWSNANFVPCVCWRWDPPCPSFRTVDSWQDQAESLLWVSCPNDAGESRALVCHEQILCETSIRRCSHRNYRRCGFLLFAKHEHRQIRIIHSGSVLYCFCYRDTAKLAISKIPSLIALEGGGCRFSVVTWFHRFFNILRYNNG